MYRKKLVTVSFSLSSLMLISEEIAKKNKKKRKLRLLKEIHIFFILVFFFCWCCCCCWQSSSSIFSGCITWFKSFLLGILFSSNVSVQMTSSQYLRVGENLLLLLVNSIKVFVLSIDFHKIPFIIITYYMHINVVILC